MVTVAELIQALSAHDGTLPVVVRGYEYGVEELTPERVRHTTYLPGHWADDDGDSGYGGPHQHDEGNVPCLLIDRTS